MAYRLLGKNILLTWFISKLNPPLKRQLSESQIKRIIGFRRLGLARLNNLPKTFRNNPPKSLQIGHSYGAFIRTFSDLNIYSHMTQ